MFYMHGAGWAWWILMSIGIVAFWTAIIYFVIWAVRGAPPWRPPEQTKGAEPEAPLDVLQRRLAAGEISVDEYRELRDELEGKPREPVGVSPRPGRG